MPKYKVINRELGENVWSDENDQPLLFDTREEAEVEIIDHVEMHNEHLGGDLHFEDFEIREA